MGYGVKRLPYKSRAWKVQFVSYKDNQRTIRDIPESEYARLGFHSDMNIEQARSRRNQLNSQDSLRRLEGQRAEISKRLKIEDLKIHAYLNQAECAEFETKLVDTPKALSHWRAAQNTLLALQIEPEHWNANQKDFYQYFAKHKYSPSYVQKLIMILNRWGKFHSQRYRKYFEPLDFPRGHDKERIADSYFNKRENGLASDPLVPLQLNSKRGYIRPDNWNWLFLSLWFGLRPNEVDSLKTPSRYRIETHDGISVLFVYQNKLKGIPKPKRWKYIPCLYQEQREAIEIIKAQTFKKPLLKTLKKYFTERTTLYGGRKGFEAIMTEKGHKLEDYSLWLGHQSIERTWRNYKNKQKIHIPIIRAVGTIPSGE